MSIYNVSWDHDGVATAESEKRGSILLIKRKVRAIGLSMVMVVAAVLAAFGAGATAFSPAASAAGSGTVNIGFLCSCTGSDGPSIGISWPAFQAWVSYQNAHGGLNGKKIKAFYGDDALNPATSLTLLHTMVQQDHVVAVVGNSGATDEWPKYIDPLKIPVIGMGVDEFTYATDPNFYPEGTTQDIIPSAVALAAKKVGSPKFAMFYCAEAPVCQQLVAPQTRAAKADGTTLVYTASISFSASSYAAQCLAAQQAGAGAIVIYDGTTVVSHVAKDCAAQGYKPHIIVDNFGSTPQNGISGAGLTTGLIGITPNIPLQATNVPELKTMVAAFNKYKPTLISTVNYNQQTAGSWATGLLLVAAAKNGKLGSNGKITSAQFINGLHKVKNTTLKNMAPALSFTAGKPNAIHCWFLEGTSNGKFNMAYGSKPICGKLPKATQS